MTDPGPARQSHRPPRRRPHRKPGRRRVLRAVERAILGAGMTVVAFVVERRLLKALRQGGTTRKASIPDVVVQPPPKRFFQQGDGLDLAGVAHARRF